MEADDQTYINWQEVSIHTKSKKEIYDLLRLRGGYYLPPIEQIDKDYIFDIMTGAQKVITTKDLFVTTVPQIKGLTVQEILKEARNHIDIDNYIPNLAKGKQPDREFVCNVVNTLIPNKLREKIEKCMATRESKYIKKRNLNMKVLPVFKELFEEAPSLSRGNERFHQLVRNVGQRREKKRKEEEEKEETKEARGRLDDKDKMIESLLMKIQDFEEKIADHEKNTELLGKLYDSGLIDENGVPVIKEDDPNKMNI